MQSIYGRGLIVALSHCDTEEDELVFLSFFIKNIQGLFFFPCMEA